ncbi:ulp1 protease family protein, partial [Diplocarpon rosae]
MGRDGFHPFKGRVSRHFGDSLAPDDAYLSLTKEDVDTLKNDWLTDNVRSLRVTLTIAFWEEYNLSPAIFIRYLEREELRRYPSSHIVLLRPSMAFMLMQTPDPLTLKEALPNFSRTTHIFLPINDARNVSVAEGGSHWSLLLVSVIDGVAFHYDSLSPSNYNEAMLATNKISQLLGKPLRFMNLEDSPQQENSSDCGVYVCIQMRHLLLKRLLSANAREKVSMSMGGKLVDANGGRKEMLKTIEGFRKEGERRRSTDESRSASPFGKGNTHSK